MPHFTDGKKDLNAPAIKYEERENVTSGISGSYDAFTSSQHWAGQRASRADADLKHREQRRSRRTASMRARHPFSTPLTESESKNSFYFFSCDISLVSNYQCVFSLFSLLFLNVAQQREKRIKLVKKK